MTNRTQQAAVSSTVQVSPLIWAAPVSAYTSSAAAHHDDDPNKLPETPMHHRHPYRKHYNPCYLYSSSSSSLYSLASSPAPAHPQAPLCVLILLHLIPYNTSAAVSKFLTMWIHAKSLISQIGNGESWIRGLMQITSTNCRMAVKWSSKRNDICSNRLKVSSSPIRPRCKRLEP